MRRVIATVAIGVWLMLMVIILASVVWYAYSDVDVKDPTWRLPTISNDGERGNVMPYQIRKSDECPESKPWAVIKESDGKVMGCHETEADARRQLAALNANEPEQRPS